MKRLIVLALLFVLPLSSLSLVACGGGKKEEPAKETSAEVKEPAVEEAQKGAGGWKDVPEYKGAKETHREVELTMPGASREEYEKGEHKWYTTGDEPEKVHAYYLREMPNRGWDKIMDMKYPEGSMISVWQQEEGQKGCVVSTAKDRDGTTYVGILRFEKEK